VLPAEASAIKIEPLQLNVGTREAAAPVPGQLDYAISGLPDDVGLEASGVAEWRSPDGAVAKTRFVMPDIDAQLGTWLALGLSRAKFAAAAHTWPVRLPRSEGQGTVTRTRQAQPYWPAGLRLEPATLEKAAKFPARFATDFECRLIRPIQEVEVVVQPGLVATHHGYQLRVVTTENRDGTVHARVVASRPTWHDFPAQGLSFLFSATEPFGGGLRYFVVARSRNEFRPENPSSAEEAIIGTQAVRWLGMGLEAPAQMSGATLNVVRYDRGEPFHLTVTRENLPVNRTQELE
jgi:hypothetical protein